VALNARQGRAKGRLILKHAYAPETAQ
jgi:hypothetical protein